MTCKRISRIACSSMIVAVAVVTGVYGDSDDIAQQLGTVIGSEQACGLSYDQDAIEHFIDEHVKASDMSFPSMLNLMVDGTKVEVTNMSKSSLTAHCAQIRRIAKQYGFTH
jgi:hypothetical protein